MLLVALEFLQMYTKSGIRSYCVLAVLEGCSAFYYREVWHLQDDHVMNHIVRNNLLKPIIDAFVQNGKRYNLLNSAVLELFEHIRKV